MSIQIDEDKNDTNDEGNNEENPENNISEEEKLEISPEEKIEELEDKLLRTVAEMDNMRKRSDKERSEAYKIGASIFIKDMLPIIDNLQRALTSFVDDEGSDTKSFVDGTNAILRDFESLLDKTGVKTINPEGEKFDPNFHEAMFEIPSDEHEAGIILQVIEQGYVLENRLLRAAKVGVSTKKDEEKPN
jgi:molecular chaperone GrpE|tara:strand:- start:295 stop:861 length:567 start_codon:yes stop_codon:yes gene_type:complete